MLDPENKEEKTFHEYLPKSPQLMHLWHTKSVFSERGHKGNVSMVEYQWHKHRHGDHPG